MPTVDEINRAAPETPVFVLHLYDRALLNGAALARRRLYEGDACAGRRRNSARQARKSDRFAHRETERQHSLFDLGEGTEALASKIS